MIAACVEKNVIAQDSSANPGLRRPANSLIHHRARADRVLLLDGTNPSASSVPARTEEECRGARWRIGRARECRLIFRNNRAAPSCDDAMSCPEYPVSGDWRP